MPIEGWHQQALTAGYFTKLKVVHTMRLSESKIGSGILHPDQYVRDAAVSYFATSWSDDRTVMPIAIKAVETYGWQDAFSDIETLQPLTQSDETVSWLVSECNRLEDSTDRREWEYLTALSWILAEAEACLLKRRRDEVLSVKLLDADAQESIRERTRLLTVSSAACWSELEDFCDRVDRQRSSADLTLDRAFHLVEAVARHAHEYADRVLSYVSEKVNPADEISRAWMQLLMIRAAGQMRLTDAIPRLVEKLEEEDAGWAHEECLFALTRVGGDEVVKAVWNACALELPHFVSLATWVLESIHTDLAVEATLHLFEQEADNTTKINLGHALLAHFAVDGLAPVRRFILDNPLDGGMIELRDNLLATCTLMEADFPELDTWREELRQEQAYRANWTSPEFPVIDDWTVQLAGGSKSEGDALPLPLPMPNNPPARVGRNELCPCNSGKKYKHCCLRRSS